MTDPELTELADIAELAELGIGEGDFDGDHSVPPDLMELYEVLEWQRAVEEAS